MGDASTWVHALTSADGDAAHAASLQIVRALCSEGGASRCSSSPLRDDVLAAVEAEGAALERICGGILDCRDQHRDRDEDRERVAAVFAVLLVVASGGRGYPCALPAQDVLSLTAGGRDGGSIISGDGRGAAIVRRAATSLSIIVADEQMPMLVRCGAARTLVSLAIPSAYFQEGDAFQVSSSKSKRKHRKKGHQRNKLNGSAAAAVAGPRDHNDVSIDALTKRYAEAVNALISCTVGDSLLQKVSSSLRADIASLSPSSSSGHVGGVADAVMQFSQILLQNSTQNYAILRKHLSQDCPDFVPHLVLPRLFGLLTLAEQSGSRDNQCSNYLRQIMTVLSLLTVISFKVKTMRKHIAEAGVTKQVLHSGVTLLSQRPHVLAMLIKLQVNIEGSYGPTWKRDHMAVVRLLAGKLRETLTTSTSVMAFRDALHNHQAVPCNKSSRAFAALAFAWRIQNQDDVDSFVPYAICSGSGGGGGTTSRRQVEGTSVSGKRDEGKIVEGSVAAPHESKCEREDMDVIEVETVAERGAAAEAAAELAPALSSLRLEHQQQQMAVRGEEEKEDMPAAAASSKYSSDAPDVDDNFVGRGKMVESKYQGHEYVDTHGLEMDEMDALLLGLDRGPPPPRFLCGLTGNIIADPVCHPRGNIWVEREALEAYVESQSPDSDGRIRWPGSPHEPFMPKAGISSLPTDRVLQSEILAWQLRKL